jgi:hypothetical protein
MKTSKLYSLILFLVCLACDPPRENAKKKEENTEWKQIFNENNLEGWIPKLHRHEVGDNYKETFRVVEDGCEL